MDLTMSNLMRILMDRALLTINQEGFESEVWSMEIETVLKMNGCDNEVVFETLRDITPRLIGGEFIDDADILDFALLNCMVIPFVEGAYRS